MAEGILSAIKKPQHVTIAEKVATRAKELGEKYKVKVARDLKDVVRRADLIFLAVRPQDVESVAQEVTGEFSKEQTLVSIVAGKTLSSLRKAFGKNVNLIRVMPNLALRSGAGMCAVCAEKRTPRAALDEVLAILGSAGRCVELKEKAFDAVTALSGSGPAYFAYMCKAMAEGGVSLGLKKDVADLLARQTMFGTAKFLVESGFELEPFIEGVATKGGTTAAGMVELDKNKTFKDIVAKTLSAAAKRSSELAG